MMEEEANSVARLIQGNKVRSLVRVFFLQTRLKGLGDKKSFTPQHVHVIGAGTMGGDIAAWCALRGFTVTLQDREAKYLGNAFKRAHQLYGKRLKVTAERNAALDRLIPDINGDGVARADVVIEAIFEDIDAKHAIYRDIEPRMKPGAVLATNTSSIPGDDAAGGDRKNRDLVAGNHPKRHRLYPAHRQVAVTGEKLARIPGQSHSHALPGGGVYAVRRGRGA
jgi:3-hydroxyacyl-CoA dehydrogenase/enoyl-CoA hydratase/3-hydroxybutyryl-CoA epimerase